MSGKIGIIGSGRISHAHGIAMQRIGGGHAFAACMDINPDAAKKFAETYGCHNVYTDAAEMIKKEKLDAVVIATWPSVHRDNVLQAINAGAKYILCEKILAPTGAEAVDIWNAARRAGATVVEGFMYIHHTAIAAFDTLVDAPESGPIDSIRASFHNPTPEQPEGGLTWRQRKDTSGAVPYDRTCYPVNACARYARSLPVRVSGVTTISASNGTVVRLFGQIEYENGCVGYVESSDRAVFGQELQVTCANRILRLMTPFTMPGHEIIHEYRAKRFSHVDEIQHPVESPIVTDGDLPTYYAYKPQLENFLQVVEGKADQKLPLIESVVNCHTLEALVRSGAEHRVVGIALPEDVRAAWLERNCQATA